MATLEATPDEPSQGQQGQQDPEVKNTTPKESTSTSNLSEAKLEKQIFHQTPCSFKDLETCQAEKLW